MLLRVVIDYLDAVATGVSDKDAAGFRIECGVVEVAILPVRNFNNGECLQRHGGLQAIETRCEMLRVARRDFRKKETGKPKATMAPRKSSP